jgi:hypothetical protein
MDARKRGGGAFAELAATTLKRSAETRRQPGQHRTATHQHHRSGKSCHGRAFPLFAGAAELACVNAGHRAVGGPHVAFRTINHKLHSAIPPPASAENLQENFSSRLNKDPLPAAVGRRRLRVAIVGIADLPVLVFDTVAGRQDPRQVALGDLLPGNAGGSHKGLVDAGERCRLARRDLAVRVTAFIARDTFCGDGSSTSPEPMAASDGSEDVTGRSWHRGIA